MKLDPILGHFISRLQLLTLAANAKGEEKSWFLAKIEELTKLFKTMPRVYEQDGKGEEAIVYLHYFIGGADWFITERDLSDEQYQAYGLADLFRDGGEMGYISIQEIIESGGELDFHWTPKTLREAKAGRNLN